MSPLKKAEKFLAALRGKTLTREERIEKTIELTSLLLDASLHERTYAEKRQEAWLARMVEDPSGRAFITAMTDQCFRSHSTKRTADQLAYLLERFGTPLFLTESERLQFLLFRHLGTRFPDLFIPLIRRNIHRETSSVLLPSDPKKQIAYFRRCKEENIRVNLNHLGEAILGEEEAVRRLRVYLEDLANPNIEYISIKISTVFSQINMLSFSENLEILTSRLRLLYNTALHNTYKRADGSEVAKFVNLDMEEYKDLHLTVALFQKVLSEPEQFHTHAGIVLQSYLPDSFSIQDVLTNWSKQRKERGGSPIRIRIVKGANLAMEAVESSLRGWEQAPFETKKETDANFKKMLEYASLRENAEAAHIGIGSHNLFDISYALILRSENETERFIGFEMLEGMAKPIQRIIKKLTGEILLYCPETKERDFHSAVAYLIRRLDENSGPENFLRHFFKISPGNALWREQVELFRESCQKIDALPLEPRRTQNRLQPIPKQDVSAPFINEPDTDFSLAENRKWADAIFRTWESKRHPPIPLVIGGEEIETDTFEPGIDPSRPHSPNYFYHLADISLAEKSLLCAEAYAKKWADLPFEERSRLLGLTAQKFREQRDALIGAMITDGAKTVWEADPEISEAIDFLDYYRKSWADQLILFPDLQWKPKGTILIAPPWNFPCSIPVSGIAAALTAGNCVIFKPAPEAVLIGWYIANIFWEAGIPKEALQFINCPDTPVGDYLIKNPKISSVILTGSTQTARTFLSLRPDIDLHAETGGKNAIIVTALADRDLALQDILSSAFGHAGQKCSACSLVILEAEVYDDPHFKRQLLDGTKSLKVGSAWNPRAKITPLIRPPEDPLLRGLTQLEPGETWLLKPRPYPENPHLWGPGIKWDVPEGDFTHQTELFGPILGVMRAESLKDAIRLANGTPYGLTSGLHSLDVREHRYWKERIVAGNLYINRGITGAIVRRQPFGGCKASSFGSGAKAGGPNYVAQFALPIQIGAPHEKAPLPSSLAPLISSLHTFNLTPEEREIWKKSVESYAYWAPLLQEPTDPSKILGQDNFFYLVPLEKAYARFEAQGIFLPLLQVVAASIICRTPLEVSTPFPLKLPSLPGISILIEEESTLLQRNPSRIRLFSPPSPNFSKSAAHQGVVLQRESVLMNGRIELLHYLREISLSVTYHRYGSCNKI